MSEGVIYGLTIFVEFIQYLGYSPTFYGVWIF